MSSGRKDKYESHVRRKLDVILGWLRSGYTEQSIAKRLGVGQSTWSRYKIAHPELREKILEGQLDIGALCVNNLLKRANGYTYDEVQVENRNVGGVVTTAAKKITREVPPDVAANVFIICNRLAGKWKNTQYIQHSGEVKNAGVLLTGPPLDKEAWLQFYKENVQEVPTARATEPTETTGPA